MVVGSILFVCALVIWSVFKCLDVAKANKKERRDIALRALEAGVSKTYDVYVRLIKGVRDDGKLTANEIRTARDRSVGFAIEFARNQGVDVVETIGREYLPVLVTKIVRHLKGAS